MACRPDSLHKIINRGLLKTAIDALAQIAEYLPGGYLMWTKEEFYELILKNRELVRDPEVLKCTCPKTYCEWHGRCRECVALHRYHKDHVPNCFQPFINEKLKDLVKIGELTAVEKERTPAEYWEYVRERDKALSKVQDQ